MREQELMDGLDDGGTEITLGIGKLLVLFFALVILCGISLGVGYTLGRNSAKQQAAAAAAAQAAAAQTAPALPGIAKPGAQQVAQAKSAECPTGENCPPAAAAPGTADMTFYQSVQQKDAHPQLTPPETAAPVAAAKAPEARTSLGTGYLVQIAAVRNQDDAKLLSDALQKQHYPVIVSQPGDKLFHVQVGPYADMKEAQAIQSRLVSSGYNAFLKR